MAAQGRPIQDIVRANWTLDQYIGEGYLDKDIPGLLRGDDPDILKAWARQIDRKVEKLYAERLGWKAFRDDLLLIYYNPGRLLFADSKYNVWFRSGTGFLVLTAEEKKLRLKRFKKFEDVFLNLISLRGEEIIIVEPEPLVEPVTGAYDVIYAHQEKQIEQLFYELQSGRVVEIIGYPIELGISPFVEMTKGYYFINASNEFLVMGTILTPQGSRVVAEVYTYDDGLRLLGVLSLNRYKWRVVDLEGVVK